MVFSGNPLFALAIVFTLLFAGKSSARVVLIRNTYTLSFDDVEADFAPPVDSSGINGTVQVAKPLDACSPLMNQANSESGQGTSLSFALIKKGTCTFESKVRNAQAAGFSAAIIYNNEYGSNLFEMSGNSEGITTHAVFISRAAGELLQKYNKDENLECHITPSRPYIELSDWPWWLLYFSGLLIMYAIVYVADRISLRRRHMSSRELKALPSSIFTSPADDKGTSETCVVCMEDYETGEKLRLLPCHHRFHAFCIDSWLTKWGTFCPVCKRDVKSTIQAPPASERTPLLSSSPSMSSNMSSSGATSTHFSTSGSWVVPIPSTSSNSASGAASSHSSPSGSWVVHIHSTSLPSNFLSSSNSGSLYLSRSFGSPFSQSLRIPSNSDS